MYEAALSTSQLPQSRWTPCGGGGCWALQCASRLAIPGWLELTFPLCDLILLQNNSDILHSLARGSEVWTRAWEWPSVPVQRGQWRTHSPPPPPLMFIHSASARWTLSRCGSRTLNQAVVAGLLRDGQVWGCSEGKAHSVADDQVGWWCHSGWKCLAGPLQSPPGWEACLPVAGQRFFGDHTLSC